MRIHDIQGAAHVSPLLGKTVRSIRGIVTLQRNGGFWMQEPSADENDATSEGIFVASADAIPPKIGDLVSIDGTVGESRDDDTNTSAQLSFTQIQTPSLNIRVLTSNNKLPTPIVIGNGGRLPPNKLVAESGDLERGGRTFDPSKNAADFFESLEGMLVQINDAVVVGPTARFGGAPHNAEVYVIGDKGERAALRSVRGGVLAVADNFNPQRIVVTNLNFSLPSLNVGDKIIAPIVGVMDYRGGKYVVHPIRALATARVTLERERTSPVGEGRISIATFNTENMGATDSPDKFARAAQIIVENLAAPDIVVLEEIQDNTGATNNSVTDASLTYQTLISAIRAAGGSSYDWRDIPPQNGQDGGEPGGNIRVGFIFRTDRGVQFVNRAGGNATTAAQVTRDAAGKPQLTLSPARIDPTNAAFRNSRKPLVGEFRVNGRALFVVGVHFTSKLGDAPVFSRMQPPATPSESQRNEQARIVSQFVRSITAIDPQANIVVLGDVNEFEFRAPVQTLIGDGTLIDMVTTLPANERYTYVYEGNSEVLDHIFISQNLARTGAPIYDIVHVNSEYTDRASDHEPSVVKLAVN